MVEGECSQHHSKAALLWLAKLLFLQGLTRLLKALKDAENNATIGDIVKEGREFQEVFNILELNQESVSQLEVSYSATEWHCLDQEFFKLDEASV